MEQTTEEPDIKEFAEAIAEAVIGETKLRCYLNEVIKETAIATFETDRDYSDIINGAEKARSKLLEEIYPRGQIALTQSSQEEETAEVEGTTLADRLGETASGQPTRAGRGQK